MKYIFLILAIGVTGCSNLTIVPKEVKAKAIAFDQNQQNAGLIDCDSKGCIVTAGWLGRYRAMEKKYEPDSPFFPDSEVKAEGANYRVSFEVSNHYAELKQRQRNEQAP